MDELVDYDSILERLAPCGVDCERCTWYADGRVRREAMQLKLDLEGFENLAARMAGEIPVLGVASLAMKSNKTGAIFSPWASMRFMMGFFSRETAVSAVFRGQTTKGPRKGPCSGSF